MLRLMKKGAEGEGRSDFFNVGGKKEEGCGGTKRGLGNFKNKLFFSGVMVVVKIYVEETLKQSRLALDDVSRLSNKP